MFKKNIVSNSANIINIMIAPVESLQQTACKISCPTQSDLMNSNNSIDVKIDSNADWDAIRIFSDGTVIIERHGEASATEAQKGGSDVL